MKLHVSLVLETDAFRNKLAMFQCSQKARDEVLNAEELTIMSRFDDMMKNWGCTIEQYEVRQSEQK